MTETASLAEFLLARVEEEELLARAFGDAEASAVCAGKRWVITAGTDAGLRLLGLLYVDHPDYRYSWICATKDPSAPGH